MVETPQCLPWRARVLKLRVISDGLLVCVDVVPEGDAAGQIWCALPERVTPCV